jgi:hypothetical protein
MLKRLGQLRFPAYNGVRCLMMPYIQGDSASVPEQYQSYKNVIDSTFIKKGDVGFLTIDESVVEQGKAHRGARATTNRALHTEAGKHPDLMGKANWGGGNWGKSPLVTLDPDVTVLLANNLDDSCALWDADHQDTSIDGDIGHESFKYPMEDAVVMKSGEVYQIGIFTPHESLPVNRTFNRQFLRIISSGVHGREPYFTENPLVKLPA